MGNVRACWDDRCPSCGKRIGWQGFYSQRPPCPGRRGRPCGFNYLPDKLLAMEADVEARILKALAEEPDPLLEARAEAQRKQVAAWSAEIEARKKGTVQ